MNNFPKFEEYKLLIDDTARFSDRRQTVGSTFVAVNSLLLTAIAFLIKDSGAQHYGFMTTILPIPVVLAGIFVCLWWRQIILKYKELVRLRMSELMAMELLPEMHGCQLIYQKEYEQLYRRDKEGKKLPLGRLNFSDLESRLPLLFMSLYGFFGLMLLIALVWLRSNS